MSFPEAPKFIFRSVQNHDFTVIPNALLRDSRLSYRARGIVVMLLSNREDWHVYAGWIEAQAPEGREAVASAMRELEQLGYMVFQEAERAAGKFAGGTWLVFDTPVSIDRITNKTKWKEETRSPTPGKPSPGETAGGKPTPGKPLDGYPTAKKYHPDEESILEETTTKVPRNAASGQEAGKGELFGEDQSKGPDWPRAAMRDAWNRLVPSLPKLRDITGAREKHARARFKDLKDLPSVEAFFRRIEASDFLAGRAPPSAGGRTFSPDFDWCISPHAFDKISEGKYDNKAPTPTPNQKSKTYVPKF